MIKNIKDNKIVKIENLVKIYDTGKVKVHALRGIDLEIEDGEFISIMGHSGSGKSTLMHLIGCLDIPTQGKIYIENTDVSKADDNFLAIIRNQKIGFVFQAFNLINKLNCLHNVITPLIYQGIDRNKRITIAKAMLEKVGLADKFYSKPLELSGGQRQRVAIARALVTNPKIILADEPTGALDTETSKEIMELFTKLNQEGKTVIIVTHENDIANYAKKIIHIKDGKIEKIEINQTK